MNRIPMNQLPVYCLRTLATVFASFAKKLHPSHPDAGRVWNQSFGRMCQDHAKEKSCPPEYLTGTGRTGFGIISAFQASKKAGDGNRTRVTSLGSWSSTIEPRLQQKIFYTIRTRNATAFFIPDSRAGLPLRIFPAGCRTDRTCKKEEGESPSQAASCFPLLFSIRAELNALPRQA